MKNEKALNFKITIKPIQIQQDTEGGIRKYTDEQLEVVQRGVDVGHVLSIGKNAFQHDRFGNECEIKVGDKVRFKLHSAHWHRDTDEFGIPRGEWYGVINDDDVLTILEN